MACSWIFFVHLLCFIFSWMIFCFVAIQFIAGTREFIKPMRWGFCCAWAVTKARLASHFFLLLLPLSLCEWCLCLYVPPSHFQFVGSIAIVGSGFGFDAVSVTLILHFHNGNNKNVRRISLFHRPLLFHSGNNKMPEDSFCCWICHGSQWKLSI